MQNKRRKTRNSCGFSSLLHTLKYDGMCVHKESIILRVAKGQAKSYAETRILNFYGEITTDWPERAQN